MMLTDGEDRTSIDMFNCSSDFSRDCYASMSTPPPRSQPRNDDLPPPSNWTVLSSLRHTALLGEQKAKMPLLIRVRDVRILAGAAGFVAALMLLVGVFTEGVPVGSRDSVASLDELNKYNFYTGTVAAMLAKPFEMALAFFVPVLTLVLSPRNSLQNDSMTWRALQFCAQGTLVALLTGAFSTLNVQQLDPELVPVIIASDLSSSFSTGSSVTSSDLAFSLRPTADTLLRTAMLPVYVKTAESVCQGRGGWPNIATTYAFFANDWLVNLLPDGRETEFSLHTNVGGGSSASTTDSKDEATADGFNVTLSGNLLLYAMFFSQTLLAWNGLSYLENSSLAQFQEDLTSWRASQAVTECEFQLAASAMLQTTLNEQSSRLGLAFDTDAASFNTSHVQLSEDIEFDAVTIEIPFNEHDIADNGSASAWTSSNSSLLYRLSSITECGETACLIPPPGDSYSATATLGDTTYTQWNVEPQIQAFAACIFEDGTEFMTLDHLHGASCTRRSLTSFLVYSFGRRVVADDVTVEASSSSRVVEVTNIQRVHTITLGRLSWRAKDLANDFNAACGDNNTCIGITFLLENASSLPSAQQYLVVGEEHLPVDSLGEFDGLYSRWTPLAMVTTPNDMQGDLLFLQNVRHGLNWDLDGQCSTSVDVFATQVEQNHWYMSFGLQEAYAAALFLLFQNAVVREEHQSVDGSRTLNFDGSSTHVTLEARIPLPSALVSIIGSVIVLIGALCIAVAGRRKEGAIQRDLGVEEIAKVLLVDHRFPRLFLDCTLDDPDDRVRRPLHTFHISAIVLHHEEPQPSSNNDAGVFIQYPPHT
ncbi:hypothetical protein PI124_g891 [Phytophthora idaei]|nr:hypothetical protein PI125_g5362 [Phytophthora idaei]KAG3173995.1 hypothetical protein PI126_g572 [Phytophthora idaei]KAG3254531.1 hypothetical protein PI124_g891 [Phytophthora idaei]